MMIVICPSSKLCTHKFVSHKIIIGSDEMVTQNHYNWQQLRVHNIVQLIKNLIVPLHLTMSSDILMPHNERTVKYCLGTSYY
jgi:L-cystine uptake protein TcyP (sodium:dicarboxylate symporter family)